MIVIEDSCMDLKDKMFKNVYMVGVNGLDGEAFLVHVSNQTE